MSNWARLAKITKVTNKGLAVNFATRSFLYNFDKLNYSQLVGEEVYLVPPIIDYPRKFIISKIYNISDNKAYIKLDLIGIKDKCAFSNFNNLNFSVLKNRYLLVSRKMFYKKNNVSELNIEKLLSDNSLLKNIIGYDVYDLDLNQKLGIVDSISGNDLQKLIHVYEIKQKTELSVKQNNEILIPFTSYFVKEVKNDTVYVQVPKSLIDLNK